MVHHDLGWWGFVLAIVGIVLTYPISLLANLTSPAIKDWWATRSVTALRQRVDRVGRTLEDYEQYTELSEEGELIVSAIELIIALVVFCILTADGVLLIVMAPLSTSGFTLFLMVALTAYTGFAELLFFIKPERIKRSPSTRKRIRRSLIELKEKLANRTGTT